MEIINWFTTNKDWFFSGMGVSIMTGSIGVLIYIFKPKKEKGDSSNTNINTINITNPPTDNEKNEIQTQKKKTLDEYKNETRILFIDDKTFPVVTILKHAGWVHTKRIKDCESLDMQDITEADILFIDVQGVGLALAFKDEGLGLAIAIKEKYPTKKVIIYSAETSGDRFHNALKQADSFLPKNSDPYEFQKLVEDFTIGEI